MVTIPIDRSMSIVVFSGAGMSRESGIPVYRGEDGIWKDYNYEEHACEAAFRENPERVLDFHEKRRRAVMGCEPHAGHHTLARLEEEGYRLTIVTQNIDGMHQRAGNTRVMELHGSLFRVRCRCSGSREDIGVAYQKRRCDACDSWMRPDITWFGDSLDTDLFQRAADTIAGCDLFVSVGTSGVVWPAAGLPDVAREGKAQMVEVNPEEGPQSHMFDLVIRGAAGEMLPRLFEVD